MNQNLQLIEYLKLQEELGLAPKFLWKSHSIPKASKTKSDPQIKPQNTPAENIPMNFDKNTKLQEIRKTIGDCTRCRLSEGRNNIVFGVGNPEAELMFVGEAPGRDEDLKGEPFVGRAGQLLTKIIQAMGLSREEVYIANIVKCRPPENRNPAADEIATCSPFLFSQIETIQPKVIVCLGTFAAQTLLGTEEKISVLRGRLHSWPNATVQKMLAIQLPLESTKLLPTYHPAFLLRNPNMKKPVWEDMQIVMKLLGQVKE